VEDIVSKLKILVADDHELVRRGSIAILAGQDDFEICAEAATGTEALDKVRKTRPDIVILDIGMPSLNGLEVARQVMREFPQTKILILTVHESEQVIREVLNAGARGFVLKSDAARDLLVAVDALRRNKTFFTTNVAEMVLDGFLTTGQNSLRGSIGKGRLTPREREIVQMLAEGKTTKDVATLLGLGFKTVDTHRTNIMRKLSINSVSELVVYAVRNGIVNIAMPLPGPETNMTDYV
jgi:DNA-binding NarL/FixJ family response regulator